MTHGCYDEELWQQRSWLGASDSTWLYSSLLPLSLTQPPSLFIALGFYFFSFLSVFQTTVSRSLLLSVCLCCCLCVYSSLFVRIAGVANFHFFHSFLFRYRFFPPPLLLLPPLALFLQHSTTFNIPHIDFLIAPSPFTTPLLFSPTLPSSHPSDCLSTAASCAPDVARSPSCWHHDREEERAEMEMITKKQGVVILIRHVRRIKISGRVKKKKNTHQTY